MQNCVIDASVFLKLFLQEEDSNLAFSLLEKIADKRIQILVPRLFFYEVFSIAKKQNISMYEVLDLLDSYEKTSLDYINENQQVIKTAFSICKMGNKKSGYPSFYDSCYHSLAIIRNCQFITSDKRHFNKTKQLGNIKLLSEIEF